MRRWGTRGLGGVLLLALVLAPWSHPPAEAEPRVPALKITLAPAEVALAVGESTPMLVVVANVSEEPATGIELTAGARSGLRILGAGRLEDLAPGASTSTELTVVRTAEGSAETIAAEVHVTYSQGADRLGQVTSAPFTMKAVARPVLLTATLQGALDPLSEDRSGSVNLTISNERATPASVTKLVISSPSSVTVTVRASAVGGGADAEVGPGVTADILLGRDPLGVPGQSSVLVPLVLSADKSLDPGQRTLSVQLAVVPGGPGPAAHASEDKAQQVVVTHDLKVEVFGESAILGALGVPLLLLLPGLIVLTTTLVLLKTVGPWRRTLVAATIDVAKASFAAVASVFVSLVVALAYPTITGWVPGDSRNLRKGYGFDDFYFVYLWSFAIAVGVWGLLCLAKPALDVLFRVDPYGDDPWTILRKLAFRFAKTTGRVVSIPDGSNGSKKAVEVGSVGDKWLVIPPLKAAFTPAGAAAETRVEEALERRWLWRAWWQLRKAHKAGHVASLTYEGGTFIAGPSLATPGTAQPTSQQRKTVEVT